MRESQALKPQTSVLVPCRAGQVPLPSSPEAPPALPKRQDQSRPHSGQGPLPRQCWGMGYSHPARQTRQCPISAPKMCNCFHSLPRSVKGWAGGLAGCTRALGALAGRPPDRRAADRQLWNLASLILPQNNITCMKTWLAEDSTQRC